jgi:hypothetical protein
VGRAQSESWDHPIVSGDAMTQYTVKNFLEPT